MNNDKNNLVLCHGLDQISVWTCEKGEFTDITNDGVSQ